MKNKASILLSILLIFMSLQIYGAKRYKLVEIETNLGIIKIRLNVNTPKHSENFLKLADEHHYDGLLFHRVIKNFMIQGGSSDSRGAAKGKILGLASTENTIEAEIRPEYRHLKGAIAAARQGDEINPDKKSSGEQFYIVQGKTYTDEELRHIEYKKVMTARNQLGAKIYKPLQAEHQRYLSSGERVKADSLIQSINTEIEKQIPDSSFTFPPAVRQLYKSVGGAPFLDGDYTVFGEIIEGMDILDKIAATKTDHNDRPEEDVVILGMKLKRK